MSDQKVFFGQSGLTESEAKEMHGHFTRWFSVFLSFAVIAHLLVWFWRPWIDVTVR